MSTDALNEQVARYLGVDDQYHVVKRGWYYRFNACGYTSDPDKAWRIPLAEAKKHEYLLGDEPVTIQKCKPLEYASSLDACRDFEVPLRGDDRSLYYDLLYLEVVKKPSEDRFERLWMVFNAPPEARCRAFCNLMKSMRQHINPLLVDALEEQQ